jgi:hypothetical protein
MNKMLLLLQISDRCIISRSYDYVSRGAMQGILQITIELF